MPVTIRQAFERREGVLHLAPVFVPRRFSKPGRRLHLRPDDYYALGTPRGAIKDRWFSSAIPAMNVPRAPPDEGTSYVDPTGNAEDRSPFKDAVEEFGANEHFVGYEAATAGVTIRNESWIEPLVVLQRFGPDNPEVPGEIAND